MGKQILNEIIADRSFINIFKRVFYLPSFIANSVNKTQFAVLLNFVPLIEFAINRGISEIFLSKLIECDWNSLKFYLISD